MPTQSKPRHQTCKTLDMSTPLLWCSVLATYTPLAVWASSERCLRPASLEQQQLTFHYSHSPITVFGASFTIALASRAKTFSEHSSDHSNPRIIFSMCRFRVSSLDWYLWHWDHRKKVLPSVSLTGSFYSSAGLLSWHCWAFSFLFSGGISCTFINWI